MEDLDDIRLSAQRGLWGNVPCSLRAFSVEIDGTVVRTRSVFDESVDEEEKELLSAAGAEIIADYPASFTIEEEFLVVPKGEKMQHLAQLIFLRHQP